MVAVLCVALVVVLTLVNGLDGISRSNFPKISLTFTSVSDAGTTGFSSVSEYKYLLKKLQWFKGTGFLKLKNFMWSFEAK